MLDRNYEGYGFDLSEEFVPLSIQEGFTYEGEKTGKDSITYNEKDSFELEGETEKVQDLIAPSCLSGTKPTQVLITDDDTINNRRTQN